MANPPADGDRLLFPLLPERVRDALGTLADAGHEVALVGGVVRDRLLDLPHDGDWDAATSARPEEVVALFEGATWENRFGTVTIGAHPAVEITSYRAEGAYRDRRRPSDVRFGVSLAEDLARRDFTVNAMAWIPTDLATGEGSLVDPHGGADDLRGGILRAVGDARTRFNEDALRLVRAVRFASRFGLRLEPATEAAIRELGPTAATVSAERVRDELFRILRADPRPSGAFRHMEALGLLPVLLPELAALRGVPQAKLVPGDALDHVLRATDAAPTEPDARVPARRLAALLHDLGKATTARDGHFIGHEVVSAEMAAAVMDRLRVPRADATRIAGAIRHHMYDYEPGWTDAAVRRFIRRLHGVDTDLLFALRRADNAASGVEEAGERNQVGLEARIAAELEREPDFLQHRRLVISGDDLQQELGMEPGPEMGAVLERLAEIVLEDPSQNRRETLLSLARRR